MEKRRDFWAHTIGREKLLTRSINRSLANARAHHSLGPPRHTRTPQLNASSFIKHTRTLSSFQDHTPRPLSLSLSLSTSLDYNLPHLLSSFATHQTDPRFAQESPISETDARRHPKVLQPPSLQLASFDTYTLFHPGECMYEVTYRSVGDCRMAL